MTCEHCGDPIAVADAGPARWVHLTRSPWTGGRWRPTFVTCPTSGTVATPRRLGCGPAAA